MNIGMKKYILLFCGLLFCSILVSSQNKDVTKFLGIPVDGTKLEMINKLKAKGFKISPYNKDVLTGEFNGYDVNVHIVTRNRKVWRILVSDANTVNEADIRIRFNNLCYQFDKNEKYTTMSLPGDTVNYIINENEDISYNMNVKNKRYEAVYYQKPEQTDTAAITNMLKNKLYLKYTEEQLKNPTEEMKVEIFRESLTAMLDVVSKKSVWFTISEFHGKYYISMFYDNVYNQANGEDL